MEKSNTFLISSGCDTAPIHLINRTFSSCKSASLNSFNMASKLTSSPCLRTVLYTADLKSAGMVDSPAQWAWNRLRASARVAGWPYLPKRPIIRPRKRASRCPERNKQYYRLVEKKILLSIFHLNGHTLGFPLRSQKVTNTHMMITISTLAKPSCAV